MSSNHGRRWENPWRTEEERRDIKARKAGVAIGGCDWEAAATLLVLEFEIGSVGGEAMVARGSQKAAPRVLSLKERERNRTTASDESGDYKENRETSGR